MAQITILQCDLCEKTSADLDDEGKKIEVAKHRIALDQEAVDLEACSTCWHDVRHAWVDTAFDVGRPVPRRGPRPKDDSPVPEQGKRGPGRPRKTAEPAKGLAAVKS